MEDSKKTKDQLLKELTHLRRRNTELEAAEGEHNRKEEALRESAEKFRLVFENAFDGISIFKEFEDPDDPDNRRLIECNTSYAEMAGRSREELLRIGRTTGLARPLSPHNLPSIVKSVSFHGMFSWLRPDGKDNIIEYTAVPIIIKGKKFTIGIDRDVTERVRTEETLHRTQAELEQRVKERTAELEDINDKLQEEIAERKRIERELYHSRQMLQLVLDTIPQCVFWKDRNFLYLGCNKSFAKDAGHKNPIELMGKNDFELRWKEVAQLYRDDDKLVMETDIPKLDFEESRITPEGNQLWIKTSKVPLHDKDGKVIGVLGIYEDITEHKKAEGALQRERNLLRTLIDNLPDAIYVKDIASRKLIANPADVHNMDLQSEAEVLGKDDFELFPKELAEGFYADDQSIIKTGKSVLNREEYVLDESGQKRWLLTTKLPLRDENGQIVGLVGIGRNITERKNIEESLKHEKALLDALMDNILDSIYFKDRQCRHIRINRKEMRDLNLDDMSQVVGKTDVDLWGEEFGQKTLADDQHLMESGKPIIGHIESRQLENGQTIWTSSTKVPLRDASNQIVGLVGISRDITELMRMQEEREKLITELQSTLADVKMLSGLVPICAHCKKIRDDRGYWTQVEAYIQEHSQARFSHGVCPDCMKKLYPDFHA